MPFFTPPYYRRDGHFDWAWKSIPHVAEFVSGDALFVEQGRPDGLLMFLLIDVMDHGPKAAFVVELFRRFYLWDVAVQGRQPRELLYTLSSLIAHHQFDSDGIFTDLTGRGKEAAKDRHTCALAVLLDPGSGGARLAGAQQPDPYHFGARDGTWRLIAVSSGLALGWAVEVDSVDDPRLFGEVAIDLAPGDRLIAMTDGITQARSSGHTASAPRRSFFILDGLERALSDLAGIPGIPSQIDRLFEAVNAYVGRDWPDDDTTAVLWHRADTALPQETQEKWRL